jgi:anti-sigma B factor antagonist
MQHLPASPDFSFEIRPDRDRVVVDIVGEFDLGVAPHVAATVDELLDAGFARVVIDLRKLSFLDSSGVHTLIAARHAAGQRGAALSLIRGPHGVHRVLTLTATDALFEFEDDWAAA